MAPAAQAGKEKRTKDTYTLKNLPRCTGPAKSHRSHSGWGSFCGVHVPTTREKINYTVVAVVVAEEKRQKYKYACSMIQPHAKEHRVH